MRKCSCGLNLGDKKDNYQGWYNYNVWNVMLWASNDQRVNRQLEKVCDDKAQGKLTKAQYERAINQVGASAKAVSDVKRKKLTKGEIAAIRSGLKSDCKEMLS